jgi:SsrA-binding protein
MGLKIISDNRKAFHEYTIGDRYEAGIVLTGSEVKAARTGKVNLSDGWVDIDAYGECYLVDTHISKYSHGSYANHEEKRRRKLLLNKKEIAKLEDKIAEKGLTVVALKMYFKDKYIKVEIGVAKGKKLHDKRESTREREANREVNRAMRRG